MSFFKTLKEKDKAAQMNFAFLVALCVAGIMALIWVTTLPARFSALEVTETAVAEEEVPTIVKGDAKGNSFSSIGAGVRAHTASLIEAFDGFAESFKNTEQEVPGVHTIDTTDFYTPSTVTEEATSTAVAAVVATSTPENATTTPQIDKTERIILIGTTTTKTSE